MTTQTLWLHHLTERDTLKLFRIEAELGSRGYFSSSSARYLGSRTSALVDKKHYARKTTVPPGENTKNCSDFSTSAEAQKFFLSQGGPSYDPHNLDGDGDGFACEWGRQITRNAKKYRYVPVRRTYSRCYVGPRGGTYTITASGRKNYGGC